MNTKTILLACVGLFVASAAACGGCMFVAFRGINKNISPAVDDLFVAIDNGTFPATYDTHTSPELQKVVTREQYEQLGFLIKSRLGALKSKSMRQTNYRQVNADAVVDAVYNATFEKGTGTITAKLKRHGDRWLFVSFRVSSPVFQRDLATSKCPHCEQAVTASAKFCPECGKSLAGDVPADPEP